MTTLRRDAAPSGGIALLAAVAVLGGLLSAAGLQARDEAEPDAEATESRPEPARGALTSGGSFYVEWEPEPEPIPLNEIFVIRFRVFDPERRDEPVRDAVITANAWMPEHNHGTTLEPRIESHGDGTATAEGFLLHMEGSWQLGVGVAVSGRMERATFDIELEP